MWEDALALLTEFLPDRERRRAQVWNRIEQEIARSRISFSRPLPCCSPWHALIVFATRLALLDSF